MKAKPFLIGLLVAVAVFAGASVYYAATVRKVDTTFLAVASPDGRYKAVRLTLARGGSDPFCFDSIAIFLAVYPDTFAESEKAYDVYRAPCAPAPERAGLPKIEWLSNTAVQITWLPAPAVADASRLLMKSLDASNYVQITYVVRK